MEEREETTTISTPGRILYKGDLRCLQILLSRIQVRTDRASKEEHEEDQVQTLCKIEKEENKRRNEFPIMPSS